MSKNMKLVIYSVCRSTMLLAVSIVSVGFIVAYPILIPVGLSLWIATLLSFMFYKAG